MFLMGEEVELRGRVMGADSGQVSVETRSGARLEVPIGDVRPIRKPIRVSGRSLLSRRVPPLT
jgi:hypothetical protein